MFLTKVLYHSKGLFFFMLLFTIAQLFIFYNRGMVVTPFYNYGMYSHPFKTNKVYNIFEITVNGKILQGKDFSPQEWDKILLPIQYYASINKSNKLYSTDIKRLMNKSGITSDEANFIQHCNYPEFENWYKPYLRKIIDEEILIMSVQAVDYNFSKGKLNRTNTNIPLQLLCQ